MKVLITGGAGFIGSHTADALLRKGYQVRVLDSLEEPVHRGGKPPKYLDPEVEFVRGDVRDEQALLGALRGVDAVYHLAAYQDYLPNYSRFYTTNVASTAMIYELIEREKLNVGKVIVASSQAALGEGLYLDANDQRVLPGLRSNEQLARGVWEIQPQGSQNGPLRWIPTDETVANPQNPYGMSKIAQEQAALNLGRRCGVPSVAMRYSIVQGPRQSFYNSYSGACRLFCLGFHFNRVPLIYEDGQQVRDFVNIADVVDANLLVLEDERANYEMFNVGGGKAITVIEFAETVARVFGKTDYAASPCAKYRFGDTRHICSDISKLKALGWAPQRSTEESVAAYRNWLLEEEASEDILDYGNQQMAKLGVIRDVNG
jgi:dTDP-L-rhamnose 4-epimerase